MTISTSLIGSGAPGVAITVTAGATITAIQLFRTAAGVTELTRVQPRTGSTTAYVEDYQLPYDTAVVYSATYTASGSHTDTATAVSVTTTAAWAVHPVFPGSLSVQIDQKHPVDGIWVTAVSNVTRTGTATSHQVIGSSYPVITSTGPRQASKVTLSLQTTDPEDEAAIWALVDDQTPILFRFPDDLATGFDDGFYSIGDVTCDRIGSATDPRRVFTLPLTRVAAPAVAQQLAWDYPSLTSSFDDYAALTAAFADYPALTAHRLR